MKDWLRRLRKRQPASCFALLAVLLCLLWASVNSPDKLAFGHSRLGAVEPQLPLPQVHPLPATLAQWQSTGSIDRELSASDAKEHRIDDLPDDYFAAIQPTPVGYLIWSAFPVQIYIQPAEVDSTGSQQWYEAVREAMQEWSNYLPLAEAVDSSTADIQILRMAPALQLVPAATPDQPLVDRLPRVRSAETRYEIFLRQGNPATLAHRFTIQLTLNQTADYTQATARHEIGHALGIWGHSPLPTDALYFSQVRQAPAISARDLNTLKRIYQQPTRLGWAIGNQF